MDSVREVALRHRQRRSHPERLLRPGRGQPHAHAAFLMACGLAVLFSIDVLAFGLRRPPLVALPLLVTLSVPVSILNDALTLPVFVGTALLFMRLLATEHLETARAAWGGEPRDAATPLQACLAGLRRRRCVVALLARAARPCHRPAQTRPRRGRRRRRRRAATSSPRSTRSSGCGATSSRRRTPRWCTPRRAHARPATSAPPSSTSSATTSGGPRPATCPSDNTRRRSLPQPAGPGAAG